MSLDERAIWEELWTGYLDFYDTKISHETKSITWARLHDPNEPMYLLAASLGGRIVGIAHYLYHRSCWTIGDYCYLQDLFVAADARGKGVGAELIKQVEKIARVAGATGSIGLPKKTMCRRARFTINSPIVRVSFNTGNCSDHHWRFSCLFRQNEPN